MVSSCAIYGCRSTRHDKTRSFFRFPMDGIRSKQWVKASGRRDLIKKSLQELYRAQVVCDLHFEPSYRVARRLKLNAVPTLNLPPPAPEELTGIDQATQTLPDDDAKYTWAWDMAQITPGVSTSNNYQEPVPDLSWMPQQLRGLFELQERLLPYTASKPYSKEFKLFALSVLFAAPLAYRATSGLLPLPSARELTRVHIDTGTSISPEVETCLKLKFKKLKPSSDKCCVISAGVIKLQAHLYYQIDKDHAVGFHKVGRVQTMTPATQALVLVARGIYQNWEQPLCYSFLSQNPNYAELNRWLDDVLTKMMDIGFEVVAFVSDQDSNFLSLAKEKKVTPAKPYFVINGQKIYFIYDVPDLLNSLRNNLIKYDIKYRGADGTEWVASWSDVRICYTQDTKRLLRLAPELSKSHVDPNDSEKKQVRYATQVFSKKVMAAMSYFIELGLLGKQSIGTVNFIELVCNICEVLNLTKTTEANFKKPTNDSLANQIKILNEFSNFMSGITFSNIEESNDKTHVEDSLDRLLISLRSIISLEKDLQAKGFKFLFTQKLTQDAVARLMQSVRRQWRKRQHPTPIAFARAFRKLFMINILKPVYETRKCAEDLDYLLASADDLASVYKFEQHNPAPLSNNCSEKPVLAVGRSDYVFDVPDQNGIRFVCGYLIGACYDVHKCDKMTEYFTKSTIKCEMDSDERLVNPPDSFVEFVQSLDKCAKHVFKNQLRQARIGHEILKRQCDLRFVDCCTCFPNDYLKKLFIRFRIYDIFRLNNRLFKENPLDAFNIKIPML